VAFNVSNSLFGSTLNLCASFVSSDGGAGWMTVDGTAAM
jgi:hypothetical protein